MRKKIFLKPGLLHEQLTADNRREARARAASGSRRRRRRGHASPVPHSVGDARYGVIEAEDGEETVGAAESARPDLILIDGSLPRLSGLEAARQIRRSGHISDVPIVFISGPAGAAFIEQAREAGCDEYFVKPFDLAQLDDVLERYCVQKLRAVAV